MKKILLVFDGNHFSEGAFAFARELNEKNPVLLTGVFLPQADFVDLWSYTDGAMIGPLFLSRIEGEEPGKLEKNITHFETLCLKNGIDFRVHKDFNELVLPELIKETRFADLLIIGSESFFASLGTHEPNDFLKDTLHEVECPVLVVPEDFSFPKTNVLAYDGSRSSVYAIKQFAYLFPEFAGNTTILVYAKENGELSLPDEINMEELVARHYKDLTITKLNADAKDYFRTPILERKKALVVSGSFGRTGLSTLFKKSFVNDLIRDHKIPVFIAHRK